MDGPLYGYYLTKRPPETGTHPIDELFVIRYCEPTWHDQISEEIWGWVCYANPLTQEDLDAFDMIPDEDNPVRYRYYGIVRRVIKTDADGKRTVISSAPVRDESGRAVARKYRRQALIMLFELRKRTDRSGSQSVEYALVSVMPKGDG